MRLGAFALMAVLALSGCAPDGSPPPGTSWAATGTVAPPSVFPTWCVEAAKGPDDAAVYVAQRWDCGDTDVFVFDTQEAKTEWWLMVEKKYGHYKPGEGENWIEVVS